jgi:hypothetical protein
LSETQLLQPVSDLLHRGSALYCRASSTRIGKTTRQTRGAVGTLSLASSRARPPALPADCGAPFKSFPRPMPAAPDRPPMRQSRWPVPGGLRAETEPAAFPGPRLISRGLHACARSLKVFAMKMKHCRPRCAGTNRRGTRCQMVAGRGEKYCRYRLGEPKQHMSAIDVRPEPCAHSSRVECASGSAGHVSH